MNYASGIYEDLISTDNDINHAVILVGYTPEYWIMRNSWGTGVGMKGYYHIKMGNHARICEEAFIPTKDP
jgi:C1A family cysteine protease